MHAPLLVALLAIAAAPPVDEPAPEPGLPSTSTPSVPSAAVQAPPELTLPRGGLDAGALAAPIVLLAGLAAAALVLKRRRHPAGRRVQVLETTSLGPKRALVLARLGDELLLLGASEAGIHLLTTRPLAQGSVAEAEAEPVPEQQREAPPTLGGLVTRLRGARPGAAPAPPFDALLAESAEDQELRRKLARGQAGSVR